MDLTFLWPHSNTYHTTSKCVFEIHCTLLTIVGSRDRLRKVSRVSVEMKNIVMSNICVLSKFLNESMGKHVCLSFFTETTQNPNLISVLIAQNRLQTQATLLSMYESTQELNLTPAPTARRPSDSLVTYSNTTGAVMGMFFFSMCVWVSFLHLILNHIESVYISIHFLPLDKFCVCSESTQETGHTNVHTWDVRSLSLSSLTYRWGKYSVSLFKSIK